MEGLKNILRDIYKDKPLFWTLIIAAGVALFIFIHNMSASGALNVPGVSPAPGVPPGGASGSGSGGGKHQKHGKRNGGGGGYISALDAGYVGPTYNY